MPKTSIYILMAVIAALAIGIDLAVVYKKKEEGLSRMTGLTFAFIIATQRLPGYSLLGVGVGLAIIDIIPKSKSKVNS